MNSENHHTLFTETQRFDQLWARAAAILVFAVCVYVGHKMTSAMLSAPACARPPAVVFTLVIIALALGAIVTFGMLVGSMQTTIYRDELRVKMIFFTREFPLHSITRWQAVTYNALGEYGGWGVRRKFGDKNTLAYTTSGNQGVMLELSDGRKILVGSKRTEALEHALKLAKGHQG